MDCLSESQIQGVVEGGLSRAEHKLAHDHLDACSECRRLTAHVAELLSSASAKEPDALDAVSVRALPLAPGELLADRYRVEERLGSGAMGVVYAALDEKLNRPVALKLLRPGPDGESLGRARLEREARAACAVKHENVVTIHDVITAHGGLPILVMDRLTGESLRQRLKREPRLDLTELAAIFGQILDALEVAHRMGVVHRDLKPENVFLTAGNEGEPARVKLVDFGVAKLLEQSLGDSPGLTRTGTLVGTPHYMAPEQAFGALDLDHRADLWAVGVMLFEALVGERPITGQNVGQVLHALAHFEFDSQRDQLARVAPSFVPLLERLLVERRLRFSSAEEVRRELLLACAAANVPADTVSGVGPGPNTGSAGLGHRSSAKRRVALWVTLVLSLTGAVALAASQHRTPAGVDGATDAATNDSAAAATAAAAAPSPPAPEPPSLAASFAAAPNRATAEPAAVPKPAAAPAPTSAPAASPPPRRAQLKPQPAAEPAPAASSPAAEPNPGPRPPQLLTEPPF